jgi:hypothetical protein
MWIQLPTTQFDTIIWYKIVELLDVLCYLKGMHLLPLLVKQSHCRYTMSMHQKKGTRDHNKGHNLGTLLMRIWLPLHYGTTMW